MRPWCRGLPVVRVSRGDAPKAVTLVVPYYECPVFARHQVSVWDDMAAIAAQMHTLFEVIVVDDGSPTAPAAQALEPRPWLRVFRIEVDVPWNWLAARNIGATHARMDWLLLTDMDHVVPADTWRSVLLGAHDPRLVYAFSRREHTGQDVPPHSASFLMTRNMFWVIGGYDERLSGVYGTDGAYRSRVLATAPVQILTDVIVRHEYVADASVTTYERKTAAMRAARARRLSTVTSGPPTVLSFPYHEVL